MSQRAKKVNASYKKMLKKEFTFIAQQPCPSSITSTVTLTSHVVTYSTVFTMSSTVMRAVVTERTISAFCFSDKKIFIKVHMFDC